MAKKKKIRCCIKTLKRKILIDDYKFCDYKELESKIKNGHIISKFETTIKFNGIIDSKLEFIEKDK